MESLLQRRWQISQSNGGTPFNEDGWANVIADIRRLYALVGGGANDLNQASTNVSQDATTGGENANNAFKIRGVNVSTEAPTDGQPLTYSKARSRYEGNAGTAGAGVFLQAGNNLSELTSAATARSNLGLGSSALLSSTGVMLCANNLSDVTNTSTARSNIGLGIGNSPSFNGLGLTVNLTVGSGTQFGGKIRLSSRTAAGSVSMNDADTVMITSGGTITFQSAATDVGRPIWIISDAAGGTPLMASGAGQTINSSTGFTTTSGMQSFMSDGISNWYRII